MLESFHSGKFEYKKLSLEEQKSRGILGRLVGVIADGVHATRNGRKYSLSLWQKVFDDPIMKEKIENRVCLGELGHPADRSEIDIEKVALCLAEVPKSNDKGLLVGVFDILSTPNGRILKSLCDYGCNIGISSRGEGELITDSHGDECVDEDSYTCECFDAVLIPSVKEARLSYVTESLDKTRYNKSLRDTLNESLNNANEEEKKIMQETLDNLGINLFERKEEMSDEEVLSEIANTLNIEDIDKFKDDVVPGDGSQYADEVEDKCCENCKTRFKNMLASYQKETPVNIELEVQENLAVDNNEAIVEELQESLKQVKELKDTIRELQEKLSVSYTKEAKNEESISRYKKAIIKLSESNNKLTESMDNVRKNNEQLDVLNSEKDSQIAELTSRNEKLSEALEQTKKELTTANSKSKSYSNNISKLKSSLNECYNDNREMVKINKQLSEQYEVKEKDLRKEFESEKTVIIEKHEAETKTLNEKLETVRKDFEIKKSQYSNKLAASNKLVEKYKGIAQSAVDYYIKSRAVQLGVSENEIKNRLDESYTFEDIDKVCDNVLNYNLKMSKLPFNTSLNENMRFKVKTSSKNESISCPTPHTEDDVDNDLLSLAGLS